MTGEAGGGDPATSSAAPSPPEDPAPGGATAPASAAPPGCTPDQLSLTVGPGAAAGGDRRWVFVDFSDFRGEELCRAATTVVLTVRDPSGRILAVSRNPTAPVALEADLSPADAGPDGSGTAAAAWR